MPALRFLVAESEPPSDRSRRRASVGRSSGESLIAVMRSIVDDAAYERLAPTDSTTPLPDADALAAYDAVLLSGSPLHVYEASTEAERLLAFMRNVFASGTPSFGSCAGLQVAVAAAGGRVRKADRREAGFARRLWRTPAGQGHPLLHGRPPAWDAPTVHGDEVDTLPDGAVALAANAACAVQAAEVKVGEGVFWGVQYHPEITLGEVASALRRDASSLVEAGFAHRSSDVEDHAAAIDLLDHGPGRSDLAWRLGLDAEVTDPHRRSRELGNFVAHLVRPTADRRRRR